MTSRGFADQERAERRRPSRRHWSRRDLLAATGAATTFSLVGAGTAAASGSEYYATPEGAGARDGSSWGNAISGSEISSLVNETMGAGDTLYVGSGEYSTDVSISNSGEAGNPIVIEGVVRGEGNPVFSGSWVESDEENGEYCIRLDADVSHVEIKHLDVEYWKGGLTTRSGQANENVLIEDVDVYKTFMGMFFQDLRDSTISACDVVYHQKRGFRFEQGCRRIDVLDCRTDHNEGDYDWTQRWPFGFSIEDGRSPEDQRDFRFERCEARHCQQVLEGRYWNGDGFTVENEHPGVEFYDCIAYANQDGGWDDKGVGSYYENCIGVNNGRNFRCWDSAEYRNCLTVNSYVRGGSSPSAGLWAQGDAELYNVTFHNNDGVVIDGKVTANDCLFASGDPAPDSGSGNVVDDDPAFKAPDPDYDGHPRDAYNSLEHGPDVGFWLDVDDTAPTAPSDLSSPGHAYTSVDLSWRRWPDAGGSGLDHFNVYVDGEKDHEVDADATETTVTDLAAGTSYEFRVSAVDGAGNESKQSGSVTVTTDGDAQAPTAPTGLSSPAHGVTTIDLEWGASSDDASGLDHYLIYVDGEPARQVEADATSAVVDGLDPATEYELAVTAVDVAGNESDAATVTVATGDDEQAPSVPANLSVARTDTRARLSWEPSTDDGVGLDRYVVSLDGAVVQEVDAKSMSATVDDLEPETGYELGVAAVDAVDNVSERATTSVTTTETGVLEARYAFDDEADAGGAADGSGNDREAVIGGGVTPGADGRVGSAFAFDGSADATVTDEDADVYLNGKSAVTVATWVKADETGVDDGIVATAPANGGDDPVVIRYDADGFSAGGTDVIKGAVMVETGGEFGSGGTEVSTFESVSDMQTTEWQHLAMTWQAGEAPTLYVNGEEAEYSDEPDALGEDATVAGCEHLRVGGDVKQDAYWSGAIDDVRVYSRKLSADEVAALAAGETDTPTPSETDDEETATSTPTETGTDAETTDGSGPGPGVTGALASVLSAGYLLKRRVNGEDADREA